MNSVIDRVIPCRKRLTAKPWRKLSGERDVREIAYRQIKLDFDKFDRLGHQCTIIEFKGSNEYEGAWLLYSHSPIKEI